MVGTCAKEPRVWSCELVLMEPVGMDGRAFGFVEREAFGNVKK